MKFDHELHIHLIPIESASEDQKQDYRFFRRMTVILSELESNMDSDSNIIEHSTEIFEDRGELNYKTYKNSLKTFGIIPVIDNSNSTYNISLDDNFCISIADIDGHLLPEYYGYFYSLAIEDYIRELDE